VTLFHRRADLSETMSDYLLHDLDRAGVHVRGQREIAALHGADGQLEAATFRDGERIPLTALFLFLGAAPNTDWLGGTVALDDDGFVLAGKSAGAEDILGTSVPGVFAVGDVRSGSVKRCATAVGEGTLVRALRPRALLHRRRPAAITYGLTMTAASICFFFLWSYAANKRRLIAETRRPERGHWLLALHRPGTSDQCGGDGRRALEPVHVTRAVRRDSAGTALFYVVGSSLFGRD
jgi:hypothetical protein